MLMSAHETQPAATIVFSHANGFPAGTYRLLFEAWRAAGWRVLAVEKYGHDVRFPVTSNWPHLRDQLLHFIDHEAGASAAAPVVLVGHSLGGFLSVLAAAQQPLSVAGVVLLDSPILSGLPARLVQFFKATGVGERYSPGFVSKRRRQHWPSRDAAFDHFVGKTAFARWQPEVLRDYIRSGIEVNTGGVAIGQGHRLAFRREVETLIYNTLPHHINRVVRTHPLACPVAFIGGTESAEVRQAGLRATLRLTAGRVSWIVGSHLFPFEKPEHTAAEVLRWLAVFAASPSTEAAQTPRL